MLSCSDKSLRRFTCFLIILLFLGGMIMTAGSMVPYDFVKSKLDLFAVDRSVTIFSDSWYEQVSSRLKVFGGAAVFCAFIVYLTRKKINLYFRNLLISMDLLFGKVKKYSIRQAFRKERASYIALILITILAALARLHFLNQPLKFDEAGSFLYSAARPAFVAASYYATPNNHILHTLLMRCAYLIFGSEPWAIRLPAYLFGVLLIPASYAVVRRLINGNTALITAGLIASSSLLIEYSVNARGYTLMFFLFLCILFLGSYLQKNSNSFLWALMAFLASLGLYTIPVMLYPFSIVICWLFLSVVMNKDNMQRLQRLKELLTSLLLTGLITLIFYLPVLIVSGWESVAANRFVLSQSWSTLGKLWPNTILSVWCQLNRDIPPALQIILAAAVLVCIFLYRKLNLLLISAMIAPVPLLLIQKVAPPPRVWIFWAFIYFLAAAGGLNYLFSLCRFKNLRYTYHIYAIIVVGLSVMLSFQISNTETIRYSDETGALRDAPDIVESLAPVLQKGDRILAAVPSDAILEYYLAKKGLTNQYLWADLDSSERIFVVVNESYSQTLYEILKEVGVYSSQYHPPRIRGTYQGATLYELIKKR